MTKIEMISTVFLSIALLHSFITPLFSKWSHHFEKDSALEVLFHLLSEVEIVFGFWAFVFMAVWASLEGFQPVIDYQQSLHMAEPLFVFCIMILSSTRPIVTLARQALMWISSILEKITQISKIHLQLFVILSVGALLGSFITEPAAMTILALLLYRMFNKEQMDYKLLYAIVAVLFVNISVGGGLTHFAAPPILIVAGKFNWSLKDVFFNLGPAVITIVFVNALGLCLFFKKSIQQSLLPIENDTYPIPKWIFITHVIFLALIVYTSHYEKVFMGLFLIFMGLTSVTKKFQDGLKLRESFLVAFFLAGLIVFGGLQKWWLTPLLSSMKETWLYFAATGLTAITDNAALTFLGSQVPLTETSKWALVSGAITGGGLTILANAPNPAGFSILSTLFPGQTLNASRLFLSALMPTVVAILSFLLFGSF